MRPGARTALIALLLGGAVGVVAALYLRAVQLVQGFVWDDSGPRLPLDPALATVLTCVAGGALVGLLRARHDRELPHDLDDALLELDDALAEEEAPTTPPPSIPFITRSALLGVVSLAFGASLGPEAPLLVVTVGLGQRMGRILHATRRETAYISASGALSGLFGGPLGAAVLPVEAGRAPAQQIRLLPFGLIASVAGLLSLLLVMPDGGGQPYVLPEMADRSDPDLLPRLLWAAVAAVPATFAGLALLWAIAPARRAAERVLPAPVPRAALGGLVLGVCGAVAPLTLFSGHHEAQDLIDDVGEHTAWTLLALVALKLVATLACLATGWFGGQIFPAVFAGMALGLALTTALPDAPMAPVVAAGAGAATAAILRRPFATALLLLFYFPVQSEIAIVVGAAVAMLVVKLLGDRAPAPPSLSGGH